MTSFLPPNIHLGPVALTIASLDRSLTFYMETLGLRLQQSKGSTVWLCPGGCTQEDAPPLIVLTENQYARRTKRSTGLYHFALLLPSRLELANSLQRLVDRDWPLQSMADHGVSEALYLQDPDGNGIELYTDRPQIEWPEINRHINKAADPFDLDNLLEERKDARDFGHGMHADTIIGHMHLKVNNIHRAEAFYTQVLGFKLVQRYGARAAFVSAGNYHHHLGLNTWESQEAPPPPPGSLGLSYFGLELPDEASRQELFERIQAAQISIEDTQNGKIVRDPSRNTILLL